MAEIDWVHHDSVTYGNGFAVKTDVDFENCTGKITAVKIKTNADRIRGMSDEKLADYLGGLVANDCYACPLKDPCNHGERDCNDVWTEWLKKEEEDHEHTD